MSFHTRLMAGCASEERRDSVSVAPGHREEAGLGPLWKDSQPERERFDYYDNELS